MSDSYLSAALVCSVLANALYYPWMHFQDDSWVKLALLTWDSVARVRARDVSDRDSELVRQVKSETNMLTEISPNHNDLLEVSVIFEDILETLGDRVAENYGQRLDDWDEDSGRFIAYVGSYGPELYDAPKHLTWVYCGPKGTKIHEVLRNQLVGRSLGLPHGSWLGMYPKLASIYLAALADVIARHNRISPATDDLRMHHAVGASDRLAELLFDDRPPSALHDPEGAFAHVALKAVLKPDRLADVPVGKLIQFRDRYITELTAFRQHVASLADELHEIAMVENIQIAHAHLESLYRSKTKPQLDDLRRALRGLGVESTAGTIGLKVDLNVATGTVIGSIAAAGGQLAVAGTAVAVTVAPYLAGKFKARREAIAASPVAYLLAADRKLPG